MKSRAYRNSRSAIISLLLEQGELSRGEIARQTGLSRAAISLSTAELIDEGLIHEVGVSESTGGRRPMLLRLGGETKLAVGIAYDSDRCIFMLVNLDGRIVRRLDYPVDLPMSVESIYGTVIRGIDELLQRRGRHVLLGIGVALNNQGSATTESSSIFRELDERTLRRQFEAELRVPVVILDNAHAAVMGELWLHGREHRENLMYFYVGMSTGGAIVTGRDLYLGRTHNAGEIGQMIVDVDGPDFGCHRGCLEGFLSYDNLRHLIAEQRERGMTSILPLDLPDPVIVGEIGAAADRGDGLALSVIRHCARYVGIQAANMLALLNPDEIILGGPFSIWGNRFKTMVSDQVHQVALGIGFDGDLIRLGDPTATTIPLGAAAIVLRRSPELLAPTAREMAESVMHRSSR